MGSIIDYGGEMGDVAMVSYNENTRILRLEFGRRLYIIDDMSPIDLMSSMGRCGWIIRAQNIHRIDSNNPNYLHPPYNVIITCFQLQSYVQ
jgi:hypothetical protein